MSNKMANVNTKMANTKAKFQDVSLYPITFTNHVHKQKSLVFYARYQLIPKLLSSCESILYGFLIPDIKRRPLCYNFEPFVCL